MHYSAFVLYPDSNVESLPPHIFNEDRDDCNFIKLIDITQFRSFGNFEKLWCRQPCSRHDTSKRYRKRTSHQQIIRDHRPAVFNVDKVMDISLSENGKIKILLTCNIEISLSERKSIRFRDIMGR